MDKVNVLLVDDELDFLDVMGIQITSWGFELTTAADGKEAIKIIKNKKPDIVVLDYMMPWMDGIVTLREIRRIDSDLPVIMLTAHPDMVVLKGAEKLKVSAFIPKLSAYSNASASLKMAIELLAKSLKDKDGK